MLVDQWPDPLGSAPDWQQCTDPVDGNEATREQLALVGAGLRWPACPWSVQLLKQRCKIESDRSRADVGGVSAAVTILAYPLADIRSTVER